MNDYEDERTEMINYLEIMINPRKGLRAWNKWKGNLCCGKIKGNLQNHLKGLKVVGPNVFIEGVPTEWDLLIIIEGAEIKDEAPTYRRDDVRHVIEVKTNLVKSGKGGGIDRYERDTEELRNDNIKFSFVRVLGKKTKAMLEGLGREECISLSEEGDWKRFVGRIKS